MYTDTRTFAGPLAFRGDGEAWSHALTLGLRDLGARGSLLGVIAGCRLIKALLSLVAVVVG